MFDLLFSPIYSGTFDFATYLFCSLASLLLGALIALVHSRIAKTTPDFLLTLVVLPVVVQTILMLVNGNVGTGVAIAGAFGLIRFRSLQCKGEELVTVFIDVTVGVATSQGYLGIATIFTIVVALIMIGFYRVNTDIFNKQHKQLLITLPESLNYENAFEEVFQQFTKSYELTSVKTTNMGSLYRCKYDIVLKDNKNTQAFLNELRIRNGNLEISLGVLPEITETI